MKKHDPSGVPAPGQHNFVFLDFNISELSVSHILNNSAEMPATEKRGFFDIQPHEIDVDYASFRVAATLSETLKVVVRQDHRAVNLYCECTRPKRKLCEHQSQVLYNLLNRRDLRAFFDEKLRHEKIREEAVFYGLEGESDLDAYFQLEYTGRELRIKPKLKELIPLDTLSVEALQEQLVANPPRELPGPKPQAADTKTIVTIGLNKYYDHFYMEMYEAPVTRNGKLKNPFTPLNPLEQLWKTQDAQEIKFHTAVAAFQNNFRKKNPETDLPGLYAIVQNPLKLDFYYHNPSVSENINAASLLPVKLAATPVDLQLTIDKKDPFLQIKGELILNSVHLDIESVEFRYDYFVLYKDSLHLIESTDILRVLQFFRQHNQRIYIHESKFEAFRASVLAKLGKSIRINYTYVKPATPAQREEQGFDLEIEKIIYLEDVGNYVLITPVLKYGKVEVPLFSKNDIYAVDSHGNPFMVKRDEEAELRFGSAVMRQHPDFEEQLGREFFYLHRAAFLSEDWFPNAFEEWQHQGATILGFNKLTKNRLNQHKAKISVHVVSGINWFSTTANVAFGKQKVTLKHLHKAVKNRSRYVELGDGTLGILPGEWLEKFAKFFDAGEIAGEVIQTPKIRFASVEEMYEGAMLDRDVQEQIAFYHSRFGDFRAIEPVAVPGTLKATLRDYQKQGLNWLNFLDDFNFGGCLADDMGLGKTLQIIAFLLLQRKKQVRNTNLIIVPTSLIFNWQAEVEKFAPSIKMLTIYGADRVKDVTDFDRYEIVLTSYGTLLSDVNFLKKYHFNYIILDESQAIKNPESQRYKAVRLLQARNRLVMTGTPVENNTFDLYGQLSFACPGLLGSKTQFRNHFSIPIDRFKDSERAAELQKRINPFILRRTKQQVASELPEKTEMVIYCEMGEEQRKVYNAYELEFYNFLNTRNQGDIERSRLHVLQGLTKLRQICNSPALLRDDLYYGDSSAKIDVLMEQIEDTAPWHKILVFSQFTSMLDLIRPRLEERGIGYEYLTGQTRDRGARVENFQTNAHVRIFLISLKAGGTGLNLTEADYVYLIDPWWNPAVENQAIDRSHRIGQQKNVIAVRLICPGTIEEKVMELQETKKDLANDLVKTDTDILKSLTRDDLLALVSR
ncbi:DEAD/DEAH box helicase [Dyadobacter fermentans]|uniref:Non-specific serine/threonine protein kinase n=1 Tax=Dyadobacter fermentans (strain ATCC 700827 / DSM 18053 / CIP 107007 / KCTC 52180 / NS114) TaxID=471854 RepID=C6VX63_DYAFD|nr:DEAD/DEAH box helicase [Dyadobacter fermentans]ACT91536.1 Non-specific serine/threonine protein kinase [Dyadobacter fermentans DSM 18053]